MAYATLDQLKAAYGEERLLQLAPENGTETPDEFLTRVLESGSAFMDSYFAVRYTVPIVPGTNVGLESLLVHLNCVCALWQLPIGVVDLPEGAKQAISWAKEWCEGVTKGTIRLPGQDSLDGTFAMVGDCPPLIPNEIHEENRLSWIDKS